MATIKGRWQWNATIYDQSENAPYEAQVYFVSNEREWDALSFSWRADSGCMELIYDSTLAGSSYREEPDCHVSEEYRIMDFGTDEQEIPNDLYEFIVANAEPYITIDEKLVMIAENQPKVYNAGYARGYDDGASEGGSGYDEGFEAGKKAEYDAFWDAFQLAKRKNWNYMFQDKSWNDATFYPKHDLVITGTAASLFRYCGITDLEGRLNECGVVLDTSACTSLNCGFGESTLTIVPTLDLRKCPDTSSTNGLFSGCHALTTIRKLIVVETTFFSNAFGNCYELKNITFEGVIGNDINFAQSTKLTKESITSIVSALSENINIARGKTLTLSKEAVNREFRGYGAIPDYPNPGDVFWGGDLDGEYSMEWAGLIADKIMIGFDKGWTITLV